MGDGDDDLEALRIAALAALEAKRLKEIPRNKIVQRNNVLVIQPTDSLTPRIDEPQSRTTKESLSPRPRRVKLSPRSPCDRSSSPRRLTPSPRSSRSPRYVSPRFCPSSPPRRSLTPPSRRPGSPRYSPRSPGYSNRNLRFSPRPRSRSSRGRYRSPLPSRRSPRRSSRSPSPRRISLSPRRRSPFRRKSPVRRVPKRRSPLLRSPRRSSLPRRSPGRKTLNGDGPRRNNSCRGSPPPRRTSRSPPYRNGPSVEAKRGPAVVSLSPRTRSPVAAEKKDKFSRFKDDEQKDESDYDSCNESLLDEILNESNDESRDTTLDTELKADEVVEAGDVTPDNVKENEVTEEPDEDCLLLQADGDIDDLLDIKESEMVISDEVVATKPVVPKEKKPLKEHRRPSELQKRSEDHKRSERRRDERTVRHERRRSDNSERDRRDRKENRDRREKEGKSTKPDQTKIGRDRESKRRKEKSKESSSTEKVEREKTSSKVKDENPPPRKTEESHATNNNNMNTTTEPITMEQREKLEARKRKFEQTEIKPAKKVISLKKDGVEAGTEGCTEESWSREASTVSSTVTKKGGIQERLGAKEIRSSKIRVHHRGEKANNAEEDGTARRSILSRLGPFSTVARTTNASASSYGSVKERIGQLNSDSSSPTHAVSTSSSFSPSSHVSSDNLVVSSSSAKVKFEVRNRTTLDPKLKIHINIGPTTNNAAGVSGT